MKKSLLALAVLGAFAGAASAQSSVTVYGKIDLALMKNVATKDKAVADNNGSRIGFKGVEDLGNGMSAIFRIESQLDADTGGAKTPFWNRWSSVGLSSKFGTVQLGRMENGAWDVQTAADPFGGDTIAQLRDVGATLRVNNYDKGATPSTVGVRRLDNAIRYDGAFGGFKLSASVAEATASKKPYALGASYTLDKLMVGASYEVTSTENQKLTTVVGSYDFGVAKLAGSYSDGKTSADQDVKGFLVGVIVPFGALNFKAGYAQSKVDLATGDQTVKKSGIGLEYKLSKRTKVYADYARIGGDIGVDGGVADKNKNGYDFGLSHSF